MRDVQIVELAGRQFNRVSRQQLIGLGCSHEMIDLRLTTGRLVRAEEGVFAVSPLLKHDEWGKWMGATLTAPGTVLSHASLAAAHGLWSFRRAIETVTRPGNGGPRRHGGVLVYRSSTLEGDVTNLNGVPTTTVARLLLDMSRSVSDRAVARLVRESVRLERISMAEIGDALGAYRGRRGAGRLAAAVARYRGLPLERARSGAEIRAMEVLRDAGRPLPRLNVCITGEEADLSWAGHRLIIEIDGGPFHLDAGEDARKEARWRAAGMEVRRISSEAVYDAPHRLLALAPNPR